MEKDSRADIPHGNKFLLLITIKDKQISGSKRFISSQTILPLAEKLNKAFINTEGDDKVVLKLVDKKNQRVRTIKVNMNVEGRETIEKIKERLMELEKVIDIPDEEKYRIIVDNCQSGKVDKRAFSMRFKGPIQDCYYCMRDLFDMIIDEVKDEDIVFLQDNKVTKTTHHILIHKSGTAKDYSNFKSKSFSIILPNYSSKELIDIVRKKLGCPSSEELKCENKNS